MVLPSVDIVPPWYEAVYRAFPGGWGYVFHRPPQGDNVPDRWEDYLHLTAITAVMLWLAWIISRRFA